MNRCGKLVDKFFNPDIAKAYRDIDFDSHLVNQIVALHFYRQGLFSLGDYFIAEANESEALSLKGPFFEMYQILEQIGMGNLGPALAWTKLHQEALDYKKSSLQFNLQRLQLVQFLQKGDRSAALEYVRSSFRQFINNHMRDIQRLMGCLLWAGRLEISPYSDLLAREHWDAIAVEFTHECCGMMGQASNSPLFVTICAGSQVLFLSTTGAVVKIWYHHIFPWIFLLCPCNNKPNKLQKHVGNKLEIFTTGFHCQIMLLWFHSDPIFLGPCNYFG